jgi:predicted phosphohydrolase
MIYAIADLHLPSALGKTMDRFGAHWNRHPEVVRERWLERVGPDDSVLVCGDISWAMRLDEASCDLEYLASLPGRKYLLRGNHDYWWRRESTRQVQASLPPDMVLVHGAGLVIEGIAVGGTRGWQVESGPPTEQGMKIINREMAYLRQAFKSLPARPRVAMLHYPPYDPSLEWNDFGRVLLDLGVELAVYGHLHRGNPHVLHGCKDGMRLQLVAADQVDFTPQPLWLDTPSPAAHEGAPACDGPAR